MQTTLEGQTTFNEGHPFCKILLSLVRVNFLLFLKEYVSLSNL
jgi:hypothetical protein